jgi:uncharacterized membrane protein YhhN
MEAALYPIPALVVTVALLIWAETLGRRRQVFILKPLSTLLVITVAALSLLEPTRNLTYTVGALVGLSLSLGGDIALMFQSPKAFPLGLGLFLLAHIAYAATFVLLGRFSTWDVLSVAILSAVGVGFYILLRPNLGQMQMPVAVYIVVISVMVSRAAATLTSPIFSTRQALMILIGAMLFYVSDAILAADRFWRPWKYHHVGLAFYYGGQVLIASAASYFAS